jgi:hypothetical protein
MPSQSPKPGLQVSTHCPPMQDGVAFLVEHTFPHAPQLFASVPMDVSQFVPGCPGQWAKPALQEPTVHCPLKQTGVPF